MGIDNPTLLAVWIHEVQPCLGTKDEETLTEDNIDTDDGNFPNIKLLESPEKE